MTRSIRKNPQRSCIACRFSGEKNAFLRFVLSPDGVVTPDLDCRLPGRGAYTCVSQRCLQQAVARQQFKRTFKGQVVEAGQSELDQQIQHLMLKKVSGYLALATKAGVVTTGGDAVVRGLKNSSQGSLLLLADDISVSIGERLRSISEQAGVDVVQIANKELIGLLTGKESDRSAVLINSDGFARSLRKEVGRYRKYLEEECSQ